MLMNLGDREGNSGDSAHVGEEEDLLRCDFERLIQREIWCTGVRLTFAISQFDSLTLEVKGRPEYMDSEAGVGKGDRITSAEVGF